MTPHPPPPGEGKRLTLPKKLTRPGGQPGGSGAARGWMRRPCRTRIHKPFSRSSVIAGADAADVVAVGVELANPADLGSCEWLGMRGNNRDEMLLHKDFRRVSFVNGRD
jgi:hypothetical protein